MQNNETGKHHLFRCSNCDAPLADIVVTSDNGLSWNIYAECCHCGDKSYRQIVNGQFSIGYTDEVSEYTAIETIDYDGDPLVIKTKKVKDYV